MAEPSAEDVALKKALGTATVKVRGRDGNTYDVTPEDAHQGYNEGRYGYIQGQDYYAQNEETGQATKVDAAGAAAFSEAKPYTAQFATPQAAAKQELERRYGGLGATAATFGEGALDELTLGLAPVVGRAIGGEGYAMRRELQEEANPTADVLGRGTGLAAGLLVGTGEAGGAAKGASVAARAGAAAKAAAGAPMRGLLEAGEFAEGFGKATAKALGAAEGSLFERAAGGAARAGLEGGGLGLSTELAREAVHDPDYDAERLLSSALKGAAAGAAFGAAIPVGGEAVRRAVRRGGEAVDAAGARLLAKADEAAAAEGGLAGLAEQKALQASGADKAALRELAGEAGGLSPEASRAAKRVLYEAEGAIGKPLAEITPADGLKWADSARAKAGEAIGAALEKAEAAVPDTLEGLRKVVDVMGDKAVALEKSAARAGSGRKAFRYMSDLANELEAGGVKAVHNARAELDDRIFEAASRGDKPLRRFFLEVRDGLEGVVGDALGKAEAAGAAGLRGEYQAAKEAYADFSTLAKLYGQGAEKMAAGEGAGALNFAKELAFGGPGPVAGFAGGVGSGAGGLMGGLGGAWAGEKLGAAVGRVGDVYLRRALRERGAAVAAQALRDVGQQGLIEAGLGAVKGLAGRADPVKQALATGAAELAAPATGAATGVGAAAAKAPKKALERAIDYTVRQIDRGGAVARRSIEPVRGVIEGVAEARKERQLVDTRISEAKLAADRARFAAGPYDVASQATAAALGARATTAANLLSEREHPPYQTPLAPKLPESGTFTDKIRGRREALASPEKVLGRAAKGEVTADAVTTIAQVYPQLMAEARAQVEERLRSAKAEPALAKLAAASLVLGKPAAPELEPHVVGAIQASLAKARAARNAPAKPPGAAPPARGGSNATLGRAAAEERGAASMVGDVELARVGRRRRLGLHAALRAGTLDGRLARPLARVAIVQPNAGEHVVLVVEAEFDRTAVNVVEAAPPVRMLRVPLVEGEGLGRGQAVASVVKPTHAERARARVELRKQNAAVNTFDVDRFFHGSLSGRSNVPRRWRPSPSNRAPTSAAARFHDGALHARGRRHLVRQVADRVGLVGVDLELDVIELAVRAANAAVEDVTHAAVVGLDSQFHAFPLPLAPLKRSEMRAQRHSPQLQAGRWAKSPMARGWSVQSQTVTPGATPRAMSFARLRHPSHGLDVTAHPTSRAARPERASSPRPLPHCRPRWPIADASSARGGCGRARPQRGCAGPRGRARARGRRRGAPRGCRGRRPLGALRARRPRPTWPRVRARSRRPRGSRGRSPPGPPPERAARRAPPRAARTRPRGRGSGGGSARPGRGRGATRHRPRYARSPHHLDDIREIVDKVARREPALGLDAGRRVAAIKVDVGGANVERAHRRGRLGHADGGGEVDVKIQVKIERV